MLGVEDLGLASRRETWIGLYVGVVVNLAVAAVLNNSFLTPSARAWFATLGATNEILGVLLIASPELLPRVKRLGRRVQRAWSRVRATVERVVARLLGRRGKVVALTGAAHATAGAGGRVSGNVGPPQGASDSDLIRWLIERERKGQERMSEIEHTINDLPDRWRQDLEQVRRQLEGMQEQRIRQVADARIELRLLGLAYVLVGILLAAVANLV